jgi:hypothetical protein
MLMDLLQRWPPLYARIALAAAFLNAVAGRFGLWTGQVRWESFERLLAAEAEALQAWVDALGGVRPQRLLGLNERLDLPTRQLESLVAKRRQHPTRVFQELLPEVFVGEHTADKELHGLL